MKNNIIEIMRVEQVKVHKVMERKAKETIDALAVEEPLEIQLIYGNTDNLIKRNVSVTMRTPGNDDELAAGFLFTEGIIQSRKQVHEVKSHPYKENIISVTLHESEIPKLEKADRNFYTTSSCGVCGKSSIEAIKTVSVYENLSDDIIINNEIFYSLNDELRKKQEVFKTTGGLHASALFDFEGKFLMLREDVGRHNALDKLIGAAFLNEQLPLTNVILLLSGRASFELIQKASMAGIKIIAAVGAPSSLAVQLAKENDMTLIGFLKNDRFNIYSGERRINIC